MDIAVIVSWRGSLEAGDHYLHCHKCCLANHQNQWETVEAKQKTSEKTPENHVIFLSFSNEINAIFKFQTSIQSMFFLEIWETSQNKDRQYVYRN